MVLLLCRLVRYCCWRYQFRSLQTQMTFLRNRLKHFFISVCIIKGSIWGHICSRIKHKYNITRTFNSYLITPTVMKPDLTVMKHTPNETEPDMWLSENIESVPCSRLSIHNRVKLITYQETSVISSRDCCEIYRVEIR